MDTSSSPKVHGYLTKPLVNAWAFGEQSRMSVGVVTCPLWEEDKPLFLSISQDPYFFPVFIHQVSY
jgi:hypothetical protein